MIKAKQHTEKNIKNDFAHRRISKRTAKIRLAGVLGEDAKRSPKVNAVVSGWQREKQAAIRAARITAKQAVA